MALIGSLGSGVSAMQSFVKGMEVIGDNIANSKTVGYKKQRASYTDSFSQSLRDASGGDAGMSNTAPIQIGTGVGLGATQKVFGQGSIELTGVASDLAISGDGFFRVSNPGTQQQFLTRDGSFRVDKDGYLADKNGNYLLGLTGGDSFVAPGVLGRIQVGLDQEVRLDAAGEPIDSIGRKVLTDGTRAFTPVGGASSYRVDADGRLLDSTVTASGFDFNTIQAIILEDPIGSASDPRAALHSNGDYYLINDDGNYIDSVGSPITVGTPAANIAFSAAGTPPSTSASPAASSDAQVWSPTVQSFASVLSAPAIIADATWSAASVTQANVANPDVTDPNQFALAIQNWSIGKDGSLNISLNDGSAFVRAQVLLQGVMDSDALTEEGGGLYSGIENSGAIGLETWNIGQALTVGQLADFVPNQSGLGFIQSRALEGSNTDLTQEFSDMITTQRAFQAGSKVISVSDEMLQEIINLKR
jgi:flagellar hook protein FlgE